MRFKQLSDFARDIWEWCKERELVIFASYITSKDNDKADFESRRLDNETEFELAEVAFRKISAKFGIPGIDLFASRLNAKCKDYVSWIKDPGSIAVDAFTINWNKFFFYAFPSFILITRVLQKIKAEGARGVLVVPQWPAQPWYPLFLSMLESDVLSFKAESNVLLSSDRKPHPLGKSIILVAGVLSRKPSS